MDQPFVLETRDGGVVTLTLNDPDRRNALSNQSQWDAVVDACARVAADPEVRCVILTGAGSAFCAGGNVQDMKNKAGIAAGSPYDIRDGYRRGIQRIPLALYHLDVPTIAAVNGPAIGAGCDLACMCDIRIASDRARFAESFVKLGIIPGDGGAWLLPRAVGMSKAAELAFTGDTIDAAEALACGLVSRVVPAASLLDEARALAARIAANPGPALRMAKRLMREGQHMRLDSLLELSAAFQALAHHTPEHDRALDAFLASMSKPRA
ncbi:MAG TPA: crotonase/enoyl-CoA hydratase family protein [Burkholderiaceae bacterium]|nr:crotonase/enoyl-CoA hydratase family protein [Burkholderiaceae bacterium]